MTYTFVTLEVSEAAYDEIAGKLRKAGYRVDQDGAIDMDGLALCKELPEVCTHTKSLFESDCKDG